MFLRLDLTTPAFQESAVAENEIRVGPYGASVYPRTLEFARFLAVHGYTLHITSSSLGLLPRYLSDSGLEPYATQVVPASAPAPAGAHLIDSDPSGLELSPPFDEFAPAAGRTGPRELDADLIERFRSVVLSIYRASRRSMPWRETRDAYSIMVSEFMLQQTQVSRVEPKYREFLRRFPSLEDLAAASLQDVLELWQGLGYNRRAKYLRDAAAAIVRDHGGAVPEEPQVLRRLPGVGSYTAAAIAAFAYEKPVVMLETNIRRLILHFFFQGIGTVDDRQIEPLLEQLRPPHQVRDWYYALMDYGATIGRVLPNANRASRHYARQSRFAGSVREVRGRIVRVLSSRGSVTVEQLERLIGPTDARFRPALRGLERDGMIVVESGLIRLR